MADTTSGEYFAAPQPNPRLKDLDLLVGNGSLRVILKLLIMAQQVLLRVKIPLSGLTITS